MHFQEHVPQKPGTQKSIHSKNMLTAAGKAGLRAIAIVPKSVYYRKILENCYTIYSYTLVGAN